MSAARMTSILYSSNFNAHSSQHTPVTSPRRRDGDGRPASATHNPYRTPEEFSRPGLVDVIDCIDTVPKSKDQSKILFFSFLTHYRVLQRRRCFVPLSRPPTSLLPYCSIGTHAHTLLLTALSGAAA